MSKLGLDSSRLVTRTVCSRCMLRLSKTRRPTSRWTSTTTPPAGGAAARNTPASNYFFANDAFLVRARKGLSVLDNGFWSHNGVRRPASTAAPQQGIGGADLPRQGLRRAVQTYEEEAAQPQPPPRGRQRDAAVVSSPTAHTLPPDASSRLSTRAGKLPASSVRRLLTTYLSLSKPRLTFLMVLTTASAYSLYPVPELLSPAATASPSLSALTLVFLTSGTALCSAAANALNMLAEPEQDAKMSRTRNRPLVRGLISGRGALGFATVAGLLGVAGLYYGVNPTVALLGTSNIVLYAGVYTPLKRTSVINTWVGAVVGAIPPLMGWAAAAGQSAAADGGWKELVLGRDNAGGWMLAALLFAWQFPHFNALSWTIREEYKAAGYRMMCWVDPRRNARVALRYALLFFPICAGLTWVGVTDRGYLVTSSVINIWITRAAYNFWKCQGHKGTARALFWAGVWQLPGLMVLAMLHKSGLWDGVWKRAFGEEEEEYQGTVV